MLMSSISYPELPADSLLNDPGFVIHYKDSFVSPIKETRHISIEEAGKAFFSYAPRWIKNLMQLRDGLVKIFGLKTNKGARDIEYLSIKPGEQFGVFKIIAKNEKELIVGQNDKHLDFRVSLYLLEQETHKQQLLCTSTVHYHNIWGSIYFFFVKPFHRLIVPAMIKSTIHQLQVSSC
jgi:hypothetical protein